MFWTDYDQAVERLSGVIINYDKTPTLIEEIRLSPSNKPQAVALLSVPTDKQRQRIPLDDEKWNNFRDLPALGWFNYIPEGSDEIRPMFAERRAINARQHGLSSNNTFTYFANENGLERDRYPNLFGYLSNKGYLETVESEEAFPKVSSILMSLGDSNGGAAFSRKFAVLSTAEGMKWLFRGKRRIGFFSGTDSLNLFPRNGFYKEELEACPSFDIATIKEF